MSGPRLEWGAVRDKGQKGFLASAWADDVELFLFRKSNSDGSPSYWAVARAGSRSQQTAHHPTVLAAKLAAETLALGMLRERQEAMIAAIRVLEGRTESR